MDRWLIKKGTSAQPKETMPGISTEGSSSLITEDMPSTSADIFTGHTESDKCDSETENDTDSEVKQKKRKTENPKKKRNYKFVNNWLNLAEFKGWLSKTGADQNTEEKEYAVCKLCDCKLLAHKKIIQRHANTSNHKRNLKTTSSNAKINDLYKSTPLIKNTRAAEIKLCGLLATNNLPFSLMDTLTPLLTNIFPDSQIAKGLKLKRSKATAVLTQNLGKTFLTDLTTKLQEPGTFFSLIMDETTDISVKKQCAFTIIYFDNIKNKIVTRFFDIVENEGGSAKDLFKTLLSVLEPKKIPLTNFVGFSSDTTNVMFGNYNSVFSLIKDKIPHIVCVKCSCHMAHLAVSKACLKLPKSVEDLLRNLGSHFSRSSYRQKKFLDFQKFFQVEIHKILLPSNTRWLSIKMCVDRVLEQYDPLVAYLTESVFEDPSSTTEQMLQTIRNSFTKIYLEFMSYTLGLMTSFNELFQSEKPLLYKVKPETQRLIKTLCSNYININVIRKEMDILSFEHKNPRNFLPIEKIYLGVAGTNSIQNLQKDTMCNKKEIDTFFKTALEFYIELISNIKQRFTFEDNIYQHLNIVDPIYAQSFETKSLSNIIDRFPVLKNEIESLQILDNEWREHACLDFSKINLNINCPEEYWTHIFHLKNAASIELFPNLKKVIYFLLILPFSNASVERVFSNLFNIKTDKRNLLNTNTLRGILASKDGINLEGGCVKFTPTEKMLNSKIWDQKE